MIIRIVKMTFLPEKVATFIEVFENSKTKIRGFKGCKELQLLKDVSNANVFFTYSIWQSEEDLNNYRDSDLFKSVWNKTKILFSDKPQAWSLEKTTSNENRGSLEV